VTHPDFTQMDEQALRTYVLQHRDDEEAFQAFLDRARSRPPLAVQEPGEPLPPEVMERIQRQERTPRGEGG
jgi:hypothetical protein